MRSLGVVQRLGFRDEGLARDDLYVDGAWRDHRIFALTHPHFVVPEHWPRHAAFEHRPRKDTP